MVLHHDWDAFVYYSLEEEVIFINIKQRSGIALWLSITARSTHSSPSTLELQNSFLPASECETRTASSSRCPALYRSRGVGCTRYKFLWIQFSKMIVSILLFYRKRNAETNEKGHLKFTHKHCSSRCVHWCVFGTVSPFHLGKNILAWSSSSRYPSSFRQ